MAELADTPWPKISYNLKNTGQSPNYGPQTNILKWSYGTGGSFYYASPVVGSTGTIYIGNFGNSQIYAINPDGTLKWAYPMGGKVSGTPAIGANETLYIGCRDYKLYALNEDGSLKWIYTSGGVILGSPNIGTDGTVYFGTSSSDSSIYAINPDGTLKWKYPTNGAIDDVCPAVGVDGIIYIGNYGKTLYAINPDGSLKWSYSAGRYIYSSASIGNDGTIYFGNIDKNLYAINPDGSLKWKYTSGGTFGSASGDINSPAVAKDGTIYIGNYGDHYFYAINANGTLKWKYLVGVAITGSPAIGSDGIIYTGANDNKIYAFNPDGTLRWTSTTGNYVQSSPTIGSDGTLYVGSNDGKLYAFADPFSYSAEQRSGAVPLIVQFTATSTTSPTGWYWDFGDGTFSTDQNPSHQYTLAGSYNVNLTVTYGTGPVSVVRSGFITVYSAPISKFAANITSGKEPLTVQFTDASTNSPTGWYWDFGDGTNSTLQNPSHTYMNMGNYPVNLTVTNSAGSNSLLKEDYILVNPPTSPVADFTANATTGKMPFAVQFTDTSTGYNITQWSWDFGDGTNATSKNPVHTYTSAGNFTVSLTATNDGGSNTTFRSTYISVRESLVPAVDFTANNTWGKKPFTVQFIDAPSLNAPTSWLWNFGDNTTATDQNPIHTYSSEGIYSVTLTASNADGSNLTTKTNFITVTNYYPLSSYNSGNIYVANDGGVKFNTNGSSMTYIPNTYGFVMVGGFNSLHITTNPASSYGGFVTTTNQSGTIFMSFTGGQDTQREGILMLAVNGTIPDDFAVHIRSSGYTWPLSDDGITTYSDYMSNAGAPSDATYVDGALNETFTKSDFIYGPQIWRPTSQANYPIYYGQDMSNTSNTFLIMFIDLNAGALKGGTDNGDIKIDYSFNNLTTLAAFNIYGWYQRSNHGTGITATNGFDSTSTGPSSFAVVGIPSIPIASFTTNVISGYNQVPIQFTDTSANVPQSWLWDFGDGSTSTIQNPSHAYTFGGTYTMKLTVTNIKGTDTTTRTITITVPPVPVAGFTTNVTSGTSPLPVQFTDTSSNSPVTWYWDFGDGTNATDQNPVHWYAPGTYSVNLTVSNGGGSNSTLKQGLIKVSPNGRSNQFANPGFETEDLTGWSFGTSTSISSTQKHNGNYAVYFPVAILTTTYVAQHVDLTNTNNISFWGYEDGSSTGTQYFYTYIDGVQVQTDTLTHTWTQYTIPTSRYTGIHSIQVTFDKYGVGMASHVDDFVAGSDAGGGTTPPLASFTATPVNGKAPLAVKFTDASTNTPTSWSWDFGDSSTSSTLQNPTHTYTSPGTYSVTLTATNSAGSTSKTRAGLVYVSTTTGALPNYNGIYVRAANHDGILRDANGNGTYYISPGSANGGFSAIHVSTDPSVTAGQVTTTQNQSGTFYVTANSGTYGDEVILLLGVTGTVPDDFSAHITTSGYTWTPTGSAPASGSATYQSSALDQTFTKNDFFYGPQDWKPTQGNADYPLFYGQDMSSSRNQYRLMFIDTRAGVVSDSSLTNSGAVRIDYSFTDLPSNATFNVYGWRSGSGMQWTNQLTGSGSSGYTVSTKTPTVPPVAGFTANQTEGLAPFDARFADNSTNTPTSWTWTFGDGDTSTDQNPAHTYSSTGTYTVSLTASNSAGSDKITRSGYITVDPPKVTTNDFTFTGVQTETTGTTQNVTIDTTQATATTSGNVVTLTGIGSTWDHLALTLTNMTSGSTLNGTVSSVQLITLPVTVPIVALGSPNTTLTLYLTQLPGSGASITSTISSDPSIAQQSSFTVAATNAGDQIDTIAYTIVFTKTGIANVADGGVIRNATLSMAVSPAWVTAHGGTSHIVIMHRADDGTTTMLATTFAGKDAGGNYLFTAVSPNGLSTFVLAAVSSLPSTGSSGGSGFGDSGSSTGGRLSTVTSSIVGAKLGETLTLTFNQALTDSMPVGISKVQIVPSREIGSSDVIVHDASTAEVLEITGRKVAGIEEIELSGVNPSAIDHGVITFALSGSWLTANDLTPADVVMLRDHDAQWTEIPTKFDHQDGSTYYFTATTPGFSYFAVAGRLSSTTAPALATTQSLPDAQVSTTPVPTATVKRVTTRQTTSAPVAMQASAASAKPVSARPWWSSFVLIGAGVAGIALVAVGLVSFLKWRRRRRDPLRWDRK